MIREAEQNAEADKKARTLIDTRNSAEAQLHEVRKDLSEHGDKITPEQKAEIESVVKAVEEAAKGEDAEKITEELNKVYPAMKALLDAKQAAEQVNAPAEAHSDAKQDDVVDATFTEKKD
jgi:molecular chaperone DnaK